MTRRPGLLLAACLLPLAGCGHRGQRGGPAPAVHYVVGAPYQAAGIWRYPREQFDLDETGLAAPATTASGLTADGEPVDPTALTAASPTLQLPCVVRVTDLDTGLAVLVRVNDRGPDRPGRLLALSPRAVALLGGNGQPALRVRVQVMGDESRQLAAALNDGDAPRLAIAAAPAAPITAEPLAPLPGTRQGGQPHAAPARPATQAVAVVTAAPVPLRLPEQVWSVPPRPGPLWVEAGTFGRLQYAELLRRRLASLGAQTATDYAAPRDRAYRVRIGPLPDIATADATLHRVISAGITDARITAE